MNDSQAQLAKFRKLLGGCSLSRDSAVYPAVLVFMRSYQGELEPEDREAIVSQIRTTFNITEADLKTDIAGRSNSKKSAIWDPYKIEEEAAQFAPAGIFKLYIDYTRNSEPPFLFHLFSCLTMTGATIGRRVWFDMAYFKIFPTMAIIIVGPSGLKKTTAGDIAVSILREMELIKVYAEKLTPEYLVVDMQDMAQGLIYAPEMIILLSKKKYMEGIVPLIGRLLDNPERMEVATISRKKTILTDVAISTLYCSIPDWIITGASEDIFTGGFFARHITLVQYDSCRVFPRPVLGNPKYREQVIIALANLYEFKGEMKMSEECDRVYDKWYREQKKKVYAEEHEIVRTYMQRKHVHVIKIAINYHLAMCRNLLLCAKCFELALKLLNWIEQFQPPLFRDLFKTAEGADQAFILKLVTTAKGVIEHTELIRKAEYKMNATRVGAIIKSLSEGKRVIDVHNKFYHLYILGEDL